MIRDPQHPLTEGLEFESPLAKSLGWLRLIIPFFKIMFAKEGMLPKQLISDYLKKHAEKRNVFLESARQFDTPQYLYDRPALLDRVRMFHEAFSRNVLRYKSFYALKSNCFPLILKDVVGQGMNLDASSGRELLMALETDAEKILFSGPGKNNEELLLALDNCNRVILLIDNFNELSRLAELIKKTNPKHVLDVGVRVRGNNKGEWAKFGIPLKELLMFSEKVRETEGIVLRGVQSHSSWNMDPSRHVSMLENIGKYLVENFSAHALSDIRFIDIGGGFWPEQGEWLNSKNLPIAKVADALGQYLVMKDSHYYKPSLSIEEFAESIGECFQSLPEPVRDLELYMEPGRWISNPAMHILLRVLDKKDSKSVITDGGINLLGWERPLTEFIPVINLSRFQMKEHTLKIYGSLCAPEDQWGDSVFGEDAVPGDVLLVPDQGAYTYSFRQAFIKPVAQVIRYDGASLEQVEKPTV